jgi:hypothetical protein
MRKGLRAGTLFVMAAVVAGCAGGPDAPAGKTASTHPSLTAVDALEATLTPGKDVQADIPATSVPPVLDGRWGDAGWPPTRIPGRFVNNFSGKPAPVEIRTRVTMTYDDRHVYVGFLLSEPSPDTLAAAAEGRDGMVWEDDSIEIFLDPTGGKRGDRYYQIIVNVKGVFYDGQGREPDWNGGIGAAAAVDRAAKRACIEVRIPLKDLGVTGSPRGQTWRANFCRNRQADGPDNYSWSNVGEDFHNWEAFGRITFR